jgi:DNA repair exonuclease SbcCD nuclease subunit
MKAIAVACSDIHLSDKAPVARMGEPDWHGKQKDALDFIVDTAHVADVPLIVAGDLFHVARSTPAMEILAMDCLSRDELIMIPGQHDLPNHSIDNAGRSSYGVLTRYLDDMGCFSISQRSPFPCYTSYPYGAERGPCEPLNGINVAVMHDLVWRGKPPYPGAPEDGNTKNLVKSMPGYDFIVAGDNHKGFSCKVGDTTVVNCGSMMRRSADQEDYKPRCYVLYDDGSVEPRYLPIEDDVFTREHRDTQKAKDARVEAFVSHLQDIEVDLSFEVNLDRFCKANKVGEDIVEIIQEALNGV